MTTASLLSPEEVPPGSSIPNKVSSAILVVTAALAPWPFATVQVSFLALWCVLLAISLATACLQRDLPMRVALLAPPVCFIVLYCAVVSLQALSNPFAFAHPIWDRAENLLGVKLTHHISVYPYAGWMSLGVPFCLFLAFLCGFVNAGPRNAARLLVWSIATVGASYAVYSLGTFLYDQAASVLFSKAEMLRVLRDPFRNRNHTATYFGTCAIVWFCLGLAELERPLRHKDVGLLNAITAILEWAPARFLLTIGGFLLCLTCTFLTQSRAGLLLTLTALFVCAGLFAYRTVRGHSKLVLTGAVTLLSAVLFIEIWGGAIAYRIGLVGLQDIERLETYRSILGLLADHPWLGTGLGSFASVFPAYRTNQVVTSRVWDYAHNTLLELAAELGLVVAGAALILTFFLIIVLAYGSLTRRRDADLPLMGFGVALLAAAHSLVDYPLQIPAYAITGGAIVGCGLAQALSTRRHNQNANGDAGEMT
jgi:hypothetical protein